ncbi:hypothetical protein [Saccharomonospora viridis]|uniref:hypothetical protein n=1 Tax=Saccharomonospora viridis TaxID=1852 RepID=UPI0023F27AD8|nr:hypothetical protein [Saccharomonospora viridis]
MPGGKVEGEESRRFNFAVGVEKSGPVRLSEHDSHLWVPLDEQPPVTDAVEEILRIHRRFHQA